METSKAAQTAYKIASQPAKEIVDRQEEDEDARHHARDIAGFQAFNENEYNREGMQLLSLRRGGALFPKGWVGGC